MIRYVLSVASQTSPDDMDPRQHTREFIMPVTHLLGYVPLLSEVFSVDSLPDVQLTEERLKDIKNRAHRMVTTTINAKIDELRFRNSIEFDPETQAVREEKIADIEDEFHSARLGEEHMRGRMRGLRFIGDKEDLKRELHRLDDLIWEIRRVKYKDLPSPPESE